VKEINAKLVSQRYLSTMDERVNYKTFLTDCHVKERELQMKNGSKQNSMHIDIPNTAGDPILKALLIKISDHVAKNNI
jgi:hypothetical protein